MRIREVVDRIDELRVRSRLMETFIARVTEETGGEFEGDWACYGEGDVKWLVNHLEAGKREVEDEIDQLMALEVEGGGKGKK